MTVFTYITDNCRLNIISFFMELCESFLLLILFTVSYKRRKYFIPRILTSFIFGLVLCVLLAMWKSAFSSAPTSPAAITTRIATHTLMKLYHLAIVFFCWKETTMESIVCWCTFIAVKTLVGKGYALILNLCGIDDTSSVSFFPTAPKFVDYFLLGLFHSAFFILFAVLYAKRTKLVETKRVSVALYLIFISVIAVSMLLNFSRAFEPQSLQLSIITKMFALICMSFVLVTIFGILKRNKLSQDLEITEQLLTQEKRRYETSKETVEIINMKCHDLKHRLSSLEDKLNAREIEELKEAIKIYDSNIKTGNEILDVVLYEKQLLCESNRIRLTCLADGKLLSFVSPSHLYALFGNAIDNAVEAVKPLEKEDKRIIGITLRREENLAVIEICNYFSGRIEIKDGLPETSKEDGNRHGYGMRSMKYVAESYGGKIGAAIDGDMFTLTVSIPVR